MACNASMSTTHIIYHEDITSHDSARSLKLHSGFPELPLPPNSIICSSSKGILLFHDASTNNYCLINPAIENSIKPLPVNSQRSYHPNSCTAILAMRESSFDIVFLMGPYKNALDNNWYEVDVFSSDTESWYNLEITDLGGNTIQPNSYISCNRNVFFLVNNADMERHSLLKLDIERRKFTFIHMPYYNTNVEARTQLGRVGETVCLVIADMTMLVVEIYLLNVEEHRLLSFYSVNVELEGDCDVNIVGDGRIIKCREMPRPVRFESFKVELPLWVDGKIVIVDGKMVEGFNDISVPFLYQLRMLDHVPVVPASIAFGLPHVVSATRLL